VERPALPGFKGATSRLHLLLVERGRPTACLPFVEGGPPARVHGTLMVVTLYAGKVSNIVEPLTGIVPIDTGVTGFPAVVCAEAVAAVI